MALRVAVPALAAVLPIVLVSLDGAHAFSSPSLQCAAPALRGGSVARGAVTCAARSKQGAEQTLGRRRALGALTGGLIVGVGAISAPGSASALSFEEFMAEKARKEKSKVRSQDPGCRGKCAAAPLPQRVEFLSRSDRRARYISSCG